MTEQLPSVGEIVRDTRRGRVGVVMGHVGGRIQLRPLTGGLEWEVRPDQVRHITQTELLSARVSEANHRSIGGRP